ncbi:MAG TPA: hypothetical protein DFR83_17645 [Deltaproteobacteria bacterium]|nr:hypothetical protein [Deltaproteobacteria bacterium]
MAAIVALLMVVGAIPSWLSPSATWRTPASTSDRELLRAQAVARGELQARDGSDRSCVRGLTGDGSRFVDWMY